VKAAIAPYKYRLPSSSSTRSEDADGKVQASAEAAGEVLNDFSPCSRRSLPALRSRRHRVLSRYFEMVHRDGGKSGSPQRLGVPFETLHGPLGPPFPPCP